MNLLIVHELWVSVQFVPQNHVEKIGNIHKDFELYQIFMLIVLCQNFSELYILLIRQIYTLQSKAISKFWSRGISTVSAQKSQKKNMQYSQRFLELYQLLIYAFIRQNGINFPIMRTTQSTEYLAIPILCHYLPSTNIFLTLYYFPTLY